MEEALLEEVSEEIPEPEAVAPEELTEPEAVPEDPDDEAGVALYLYTYGELPPHFISKARARELGWQGGEIEDFLPGAAIGGDRFGNYEKRLPLGAAYYECDIDTVGRRSRGAKRLIYTADGQIYATHDHYETFTLLYGEE
ncbi:MAG: ribonuclease [Clostridia bacterium]|nr:ribonuclease [Clostridia bacterium]